MVNSNLIELSGYRFTIPGL